MRSTEAGAPRNSAPAVHQHDAARALDELKGPVERGVTAAEDHQVLVMEVAASLTR